MDEQTKADTVKIWINDHPKTVALAMLATAGVAGIFVGRKLTVSSFDKFLHNLENRIQADINDHGSALMKVTHKGYTWEIKNLES
jgi:hypothetical protein